MKQNIKELINTFSKDDFFKTVDLHLHSSFSDGVQTPENLLQQAKEKGYKYISICDHNTVNAYLHTNILKEEMVIPAIEFDCWHQGVLIHLLGYGFDVNNNLLKQFYAKNKKRDSG